jgi:hypothetical protein
VGSIEGGGARRGHNSAGEQPATRVEAAMGSHGRPMCSAGWDGVSTDAGKGRGGVRSGRTFSVENARASPRLVHFAIAVAFKSALRRLDGKKRVRVCVRERRTGREKERGQERGGGERERHAHTQRDTDIGRAHVHTVDHAHDGVGEASCGGGRTRWSPHPAPPPPPPHTSSNAHVHKLQHDNPRPTKRLGGTRGHHVAVRPEGCAGGSWTATPSTPNLT